MRRPGGSAPLREFEMLHQQGRVFARPFRGKFLDFALPLDQSACRAAPCAGQRRSRAHVGSSALSLHIARRICFWVYDKSHVGIGVNRLRHAPRLFIWIVATGRFELEPSCGREVEREPAGEIPSPPRRTREPRRGLVGTGRFPPQRQKELKRGIAWSGRADLNCRPSYPKRSRGFSGGLPSVTVMYPGVSIHAPFRVFLMFEALPWFTAENHCGAPQFPPPPEKIGACFALKSSQNPPQCAAMHHGHQKSPASGIAEPR